MAQTKFEQETSKIQLGRYCKIGSWKKYYVRILESSGSLYGPLAGLSEGNYQDCVSINAENLLTGWIIDKSVRKILSLVDAFCLCLFKSLNILVCQQFEVSVALQAKFLCRNFTVVTFRSCIAKYLVKYETENWYFQENCTFHNILDFNKKLEIFCNGEETCK